MKKRYIETGKVVGTHGIKGEVRVQPWADTPNFLVQFKTLYTDENGENSLKIISSRAHKNIVLMKIEGFKTIEQAETLRGKTLFIDRGDVSLEKGAYFQCDLFGCKVFDAVSGEPLGAITDVSQTGANDVWHIKKDGKEYLIPSIPDVVISVDIDNQKVVIHPLKGIFDDEN
ncbi:MAG: ribosome maturation factor RimM [Clostridia bacterium]|nr:ribosome maturation factor RimM [Clostridia bacterium]